MLGVLLTEEDTVGESFYNPLLPVVVDELTDKGLLVENDGALCVFPEGFTNRQGEPLPAHRAQVRRRLRLPGHRPGRGARPHRPARRASGCSTWSGPSSPCTCAWSSRSAALAGYLHEVSDAVHVALRHRARHRRQEAGQPGRRLGAAGRPAVRGGRAGRHRDEGPRQRDCPPEQQAAVARALGIGAVKYADLSTEPMRDYVFDWDRMLAFEGNTGPVPAVRARPHPLDLPSRRGGSAAGRDAGRGSTRRPSGPWRCSSSASARRWRRRRRPSARPSSAPTSSTWPRVFTTFYEACRVLVPDEDVRTSRLALCDLTARVLEQGLSLLGMEAPAQM